jgi:ATP-dependent protease HslVU (ClpYQ) peptidase subunit
MTCIIGFVEKDKVYIGGDSAGVSGYHIQIRSDEKVFRNGPFIMGFTSSFRMGQLLRYVFEPPAQSHADDMKFMVGEFIPEVKKCFKDGGFQKSKEGSDSGGSFLVGYKGKLYEIDDDYQVALLSDNIAAVGCGSPEAKGAMYALANTNFTPPEKIKKALEITSYLNTGVRPPFVVEEISISESKSLSLQIPDKPVVDPKPEEEIPIAEMVEDK